MIWRAKKFYLYAECGKIAVAEKAGGIVYEDGSVNL